MEAYGFQDIVAQCRPSLGFGEDGMPQRSGAEAAFVGISNLENELHQLRIAQPEPLSGTYLSVLIFGRSIGSTGSKRPKEKIAVAEAMAMYCLPSTS